MQPRQVTRQMSVEEILSLAKTLEREAQEFYEEAIREVGPDLRLELERISAEHEEDVRKIDGMLTEIAILRDMTAPIAD